MLVISNRVLTTRSTAGAAEKSAAAAPTPRRSSASAPSSSQPAERLARSVNWSRNAGWERVVIVSDGYQLSRAGLLVCECAPEAEVELVAAGETLRIDRMFR